jgi:hypothetical protein
MRPENTTENADRCKCPGCPTYNDCMTDGDERLFCGRGKTDCDPSMNGCICGECPVWQQNDLSDYYYCIEGAAK